MKAYSAAMASRGRKKSLRIAAALLWAFAVLLVLSRGTSQASGDYTPSGVHYSRGLTGSWAYAAEPGGTVLDVGDAGGAWNVWIGSDRFYAGSTSGCGSSVSCVVFGNDSTSVTINGAACAVPEVSPGAWAETWVDAGDYRNISCGGTTAYPIFVVAFNDENSYSAAAKLHIARHEIAHAFKLADENHTCWWGADGWYYPLLNNGLYGSCSSFPNNYSGSAGEVSKAKSNVGW